MIQHVGVGGQDLLDGPSPGATTRPNGSDRARDHARGVEPADGEVPTGLKDLVERALRVPRFREDRVRAVGAKLQRGELLDEAVIRDCAERMLLEGI